MKPIKLHIRAFGPYLKPQTVDFLSLSADGLFLIGGDTGAGKTAILDAISYALYGRSSGGLRGDLSTMRCTLATDDIPTLLEFTFEASGRLWKFCRTLEVKTSRDGSKTLTASQTALVADLPCEGEPSFVRASESNTAATIRKLAESVLGLTWEQFRQVVILPQGQFETFLVAPSDEKEKILVSLLGAQLWQKTAAEMCAVAKDEYDALKLRRTALETRYASVNATDIESLKTLVSDAHVCLSSAKAENAELSAMLEQNELEYLRAEKLASTFADLDEARAQLEVLSSDETRQRLADTRALIARIDGARSVAPFADAKSKAEEEYLFRFSRTESAIGKQSEAEESLEKADNALKLAESKAEVTRSLEVELRRLADLREVYASATTLEAEYSAASLARHRSERDAAKLSGEFTSCDATLKKLIAEREHIIGEVIAKLPELRESARVARENARLFGELEIAAQRLDDQNAYMSRLKTASDTLFEALEVAKAEEERVREEYGIMNAAKLAEDLTEGSPCPVCGSTHHPSPARSQRTVTHESLKNAESRVRKLDNDAKKLALDLEKVRLSIADIESKRDATLAQLGDIDAATIDLRLKEAEAALESAERQNEKLPTLNIGIAERTTESERLRESLDNAQKQLSECIIREENAQKLLAESREKLDADIPSVKALERRIALTESEIATLASTLDSAREALNSAKIRKQECDTLAVTASEEFVKASSARAEADAALKKALAENSLESLTDYESAMSELAREGELREVLRTHEGALDDLRRRISRGESLVGETERPDIASLKGELDKLKASAREASDRLTLASADYERLYKLAAECESESDELSTLESRNSRRMTFAKALRGDSGIGILRYVLGVTLSEVTSEANRLLSDALGGRYTLRRTLEASSGRTKKVGLELEVLDAYTGTPRPVGGLSGGEKFICALALSLGLCAVVTRSAGGRGEEAVFIDEGFGTLDPNAVDDAMRMLTKVKGTRGTVGIISHVGALAAVTPRRLIVKSTKNGSEIM